MNVPDIGWIEWLSKANRAEFLEELERWKATAEFDELLRRDPAMRERVRRHARPASPTTP
jgi:hypothetical protein